MGVYGVTGGVIAGEIAKKFMPALFNVFKIKKLDEDKIQEIQSTTYPFYFEIIFICWIFLYIGISIGSIFLIIYSFPRLQELLFSSGAIYFSANSDPAYAALVNFPGFLLLGGSILAFFTWRVSSHTFKNFLLYRGLQGGSNFDFLASFKPIFVLGIIYYLLTAPIFYLLLKDYIAIFEDRVVVNRFLPFFDRVYNVNQLKEAKISYQKVSLHFRSSDTVLIKNGDMTKIKEWLEANKVVIETEVAQ